ncbi:MAG: exodeoxyribonuclease V subunit beta [Desulfobulbales bacterium]
MLPKYCSSPQPKTFDLVSSPLAGINLIDASAGTGKTYTICGLVLRLLLEKDLTIEQILVVTYTEAATQDLRDRIRQLLHHALEALNAASNDEFLQKYLATIADRDKAGHKLSNALRSFDEAAIFTIHGFCQRQLLENSFESNTLFDSELIADDSYLIKEIIEDFWRCIFSQSSDFFSQYAATKFTPEALQDFLGPLLPHAFLQFVPAIEIDSGCNHLSDTEAEYATAYREVCLEWTSAREAICTDLLDSPRLKRNTYNLAAVSELIIAMDDMAAASNPSPQLFTKFERLTSSSITKGTKVRETPNIIPFYERCQNLVTLRERLLTLYDNCLLALKKRLFDTMPHELESRKTRDNVFSFDDLLRNMHKALTGVTSGSFLARTLAAKYPAALIDEFQDTDRLQYEIFKIIYRNDALLFLIGDPKQAIYSFRGADIHTYMDAAAGSSLSHHTLGTNYRSDSRLVEAINTFFCRPQNPFVYEAISFQPIEAALKKDRQFLTIDGMKEEPFIICYLERKSDLTQSKNREISKSEARQRITSRVTAEISRLLKLASENRACLNDRQLVPGDIAVLVRKNSEAQQIQEALGTIKIPSVLHSGEDLFATEEAKEMALLLEAISAPGNIRRLKTALITRFLGLPPSSITQSEITASESEENIEHWLARFRIYHKLWNRYGFMRMFWYLIHENRVRQRVLASKKGERVLTNILHLAEILHRESINQGLNMVTLLGYLQNRLAEVGTKDIEHQLRLESDEDRVKIVTIHKAKGLEYPVVFCPFTWEGTRLKTASSCLFHQQDSDGATKLIYDGGTPEFASHLKKARQEELAENLRLLYVGLTRAVHRCYFFWGPISGAGTSAPAYLLHQDLSNSDKIKAAVTGPTDLMERIAERFAGLSDPEILADLQKLAGAADGSIKISGIDEQEQYFLPESSDHGANLRCQEFNGTVSNTWKISSFSSLTAHKSGKTPETSIFLDETPDRDATNVTPPSPEELTDLEESIPDIFSFPHGARPGTLMHQLLERTDFSRNPPLSEGFISEKLQYFGYETTWCPVLLEMLENLANIVLHKDIPDLKLSNVPLTNCLHELEFYYPLSTLTNRHLKEIFQAMKLPLPPSSAVFMDRQLDRLTFAPAKGFMRGFIDLVFEFDNRFYLVDWKSNHLGARIENYHRNKLQDEILGNYYNLQYHLYCLALHLYLTNRFPNYDYKSHFGGVFYVFLRGTKQNLGPDYGIYHDLPTSSTIKILETELLPVNKPNL